MKDPHLLWRLKVFLCTEPLIIEVDNNKMYSQRVLDRAFNIIFWADGIGACGKRARVGKRVFGRRGRGP